MKVFKSNLVYERLNDDYVVLKEDLVFCFTLRQLYGCRKKKLKEMCRLSRLDPDKVISIVAPKGYVTDLASIPKKPKFLRKIIKPDGPWEDAAVLHDVLYGIVKAWIEVNDFTDPLYQLMLYFTRFSSDRLFYIAMRATGINVLIAGIFFMAVRIGGSKFWNEPPCFPLDYGNIKYINGGIIRNNYNPFKLSHESGIDIGNIIDDTRDAQYHMVRLINMKRPLLIPVS